MLILGMRACTGMCALGVCDSVSQYALSLSSLETSIFFIFRGGIPLHFTTRSVNPVYLFFHSSGEPLPLISYSAFTNRQVAHFSLVPDRTGKSERDILI